MKTFYSIVLITLAPFYIFAQCTNGSINSITVTPSSTSATVSWTDNITAVGNGSVNNVQILFGVLYVSGVSTPVIGGPGVTFQNVPFGKTATINGLASGTSYSFRIIARTVCSDAADTQLQYFEDKYSSAVSKTLIPSTPVITGGLSNSASTIVCNWNASTGATGYDVEITNSSGVVVLNPTNVAGVQFTGSGLVSNVNYFYRTAARNSGGVSSYSAKSAAILTRPAAPTFSAASTVTVTSTSMQVGWDAVSGTGAVTYRLDVSTDPNFNTFTTSDLLVNGTTSPVINGLSGGTTYYYRVRAVNSSGPSDNSLRNQLLTAPIKPPSFTVTSPTATGGSANWTSSPTATQYELYVANDASFNFPVVNYNPKVIMAPALAENLNGLNSSTDYFLKLRAKNGTDAFSDFIFTTFKTLIAPLLAPTFPATPEVSIATNSFQVQWNSVPGATSYQLDVSTDPDFGSFVVNNQTVNGTTSPVVSNLSGGTLYYYRVRAVNSSAITSDNSEVKEILTAPIAPGGFTVNASTATSLSVNWVASPTATQYQLFVSTNANFTSFVGDYSPKLIDSGTNSEVISGLTTSTTYFLRVRAKNGANSLSDFASTSGTPNAGNGLQLSPIAPSTHAAGVSQNISISVTGNTGSTVVKLHHKQNSEAAYSEETLSLSGGTTYSTPLSDTWFDDLGMEYFFEVVDQASQVTTSPGKIATAVDNVIVPLENFGSELANYQIITIPYALPGRALVGDVFEQVVGLGEYNKKRWRLFRYQGGANVEYSDGIKASDIGQGLAYWFISKNDVSLSLGAGSSYNAIDDHTPFVMNLKKGWNQIGNPFPHRISWQAVRLVNPDITSDFLIYNKENSSLASTDLIEPYTGGFVFVDKDIQLSIPLNGSSSGGRVKNNPGANPLANSLDWILPIQLEQGKVVNTVAGIGMVENAKESKDSFDQVTPPRFIEYVEMNSRHPDFEYPLSRDVVDHQGAYSWEFKIESNSNEPVRLTWDQSIPLSRDGQLVLYDKTKNVLVDMARSVEYTSVPGATISFHYSQIQRIEIPTLELGKPYPNPFRDELTIPFGFSTAEFVSGEFEVRDLSGQVVNHSEIAIDTGLPGIQSVTWDGTTSQGYALKPGMYFYQIQINNGTENLMYKGKVIKQ